MPSDLISNIRKKLQDRFTILASHSIEQRRTNSKKIALTAKIDYEKLSAYFVLRPYDGIPHTLSQTTQLAKATTYYSLKHHSKSRIQMLSHKRLNDIIATDSYSANEKSIEGCHCTQVFFGMTSKILYVADITSNRSLLTYI
jgi:hypothetical protein